MVCTTSDRGSKVRVGILLVAVSTFVVAAIAGGTLLPSGSPEKGRVAPVPAPAIVPATTSVRDRSSIEVLNPVAEGPESAPTPEAPESDAPGAGAITPTAPIALQPMSPSGAAALTAELLEAEPLLLEILDHR